MSRNNNSTGKEMKTKYTNRFLIILIKLAVLLNYLVFSISIYSAEIIAIATHKVGDVVYQRGNKELAVTKGQIFEKKDKITTKNGTIDLQIGQSSVVRIGKFSTVLISELLEKNEKQKIELNLNKGSIFIKVVKKLDKNSEFKVVSPTLVAGVRGTEFMIQAGDDSESIKEEEKIQEGVYVNEGSVEVKPDYSKKPIIVSEDQELVTSQKKLQAEILNEYVREKMKILETLNVMKEINYKNLQEQRENNKELLKK